MIRTNNDFENILLERRSIKKFDENFKIPKEDMLKIIEEATKAPSSINMQPWRFVVVESKEGKDKLRPLIEFNVEQNDTSSAMIIVFGDTHPHSNAEKIYGQAVEKGYMPKEVKEQLLGAFIPKYNNLTAGQMNDIVKVDASLAAMQLMLVARSYGYETNAIGGFNHSLIAETFGLDKKRYVPVLIIAIGKKADKEGRPTFRLDSDEITIFV